LQSLVVGLVVTTVADDSVTGLVVFTFPGNQKINMFQAIKKMMDIKFPSYIPKEKQNKIEGDNEATQIKRQNKIEESRVLILYGGSDDLRESLEENENESNKLLRSVHACLRVYGVELASL
jgi:hypothetical protein